MFLFLQQSTSCIGVVGENNGLALQLSAPASRGFGPGRVERMLGDETVFERLAGC